MLSPSENKLDRLGIKNISLRFLTVFYLTQPSNKQIICLNSKNEKVHYPYYSKYLGSTYVYDEKEEKRERNLVKRNPHIF